MPKGQPFTFEKFKEIYSQVPRLCVDLVIVKDKQYLLTLRKSHGWEGQWHLAGGTVYYQEPIEKTAARVAADELGIKIRIEKCLGFIEYPSEEKARGFGYSVSIALLCTPLKGEIRVDGQAAEAKYFSVLPKNTIREQRVFLAKLSANL